MRNQSHGHDEDRGPGEIGQSQKPDEGHVTAQQTPDNSGASACCRDRMGIFTAAWLIAQLSPNFPPRDQPRGTIRPA